jgi:hypothetical protein
MGSLIIERVQSVYIDCSGGDCLCQQPSIPGLLTTETNGQELGIAQAKKALRLERANRSSQSFKGGFGRGKRYLLLEDDAKQRREAGGPCPQWRWPEALDDRVKVGVTPAKFLDSEDESFLTEMLGHGLSSR